MAEGEVTYEVRADDSKVSGDLDKTNSKIASIAGSILKAIGAAAVAAGTAVIKVGSDFEAAMSQVAATMGYSVEELRDSSSEAAQTMRELTEAAMAVGETTIFSAKQGAEALDFLAQAGYTASESIALMPKMLDAASAAGEDLGRMTSIVVDGLKVFGQGIDGVDEFLDKMTVSAQMTNADMTQMGEAFLTVGGTATHLKGGITEANVVLGILADRGIKASEGGKLLRNIIISLTAPTDKGAKAFKELGLEIFDLEGNLRPLPEIFIDMKNAMASMTEEEYLPKLRDMFYKADIRGVEALLGTTTERFYELTEAIDNSTGATARAAEVQRDNLKGSMSMLIGSLENLALAIYDKLEVPLKDIIDTLTEFFIALRETDLVDSLAESLSGLAKIIGDVLMQVLPILTGLLETLVPPLLQLVNSILPPLVQLLEVILGPLGELVEQLLIPIINVLDAILTPLVKLIEVILPPLIEMLNSILRPLNSFISELAPQIGDVLNSLGESLGKILEALMPLFTDVLEPLLGLLFELLGAILEPLLEVLDTLLEPLTELLAAILPGIIGLIEWLMPLIQLIVDILRVVIDVLGALSQLLAQVFGVAISQAAKDIENFIATVKAAWQALVDLAVYIYFTFKDDWEKAWTAVVDVFKNIFNTISDIAAKVLNGVLESINGVISGLNQVMSLIGDAQIPSFPLAQPIRLSRGMDRVPYDDMPALLHRDEAVLNRVDAQEWRASRAAAGSNQSSTSTTNNGPHVEQLIIYPDATQWGEIMTLLKQAQTTRQYDRSGYREG